MRDMIIRLKYHGERHLGRTLAEMAAGEWDRVPGSADTVVPVPSNRSTLRRRGYNQVAVIGRSLCRITGCTLAHLLARNPGPSQVGLTGAERRRNLAGVFRAVRPAPRGRVWLLDDVTATGETLARCRRVLLLAGAGEVVCLAVNFRETGDESMIERPGKDGVFSIREDDGYVQTAL